MAPVRAIAMELVEGQTLAEKIARSGSGLTLPEAVTIARQIADALVAAYDKGIIHRDLKPGNIKMTSDGTVKVLDFGLSKLLASTGDDRETESITLDATREGGWFAYGQCVVASRSVGSSRRKGYSDPLRALAAHGNILVRTLRGVLNPWPNALEEP